MLKGDIKHPALQISAQIAIRSWSTYLEIFPSNALFKHRHCIKYLYSVNCSKFSYFSLDDMMDLGIFTSQRGIIQGGKCHFCHSFHTGLIQHVISLLGKGKDVGL